MVTYIDSKKFIGTESKNRIRKNLKIQSLWYKKIGRNFDDIEVQENMKFYIFNVENNG